MHNNVNRKFLKFNNNHSHPMKKSKIAKLTNKDHNENGFKKTVFIKFNKYITNKVDIITLVKIRQQ